MRLSFLISRLAKPLPMFPMYLLCSHNLTVQRICFFSYLKRDISMISPPFTTFQNISTCFRPTEVTTLSPKAYPRHDRYGTPLIQEGRTGRYTSAEGEPQTSNQIDRHPHMHPSPQLVNTECIGHHSIARRSSANSKSWNHTRYKLSLSQLSFVLLLTLS